MAASSGRRRRENQVRIAERYTTVDRRLASGRRAGAPALLPGRATYAGATSDVQNAQRRAAIGICAQALRAVARLDVDVGLGAPARQSVLTGLTTKKKTTAATMTKVSSALRKSP